MCVFFAFLNLVKELEEDDAVLQVAVQIVHKRVDAHAVHPVAKRLLLARLVALAKIKVGQRQVVPRLQSGITEDPREKKGGGKNREKRTKMTMMMMMMR